MGQEGREKGPVANQYYCRQCRTWSDSEKCPDCSNPGVLYKLPDAMQTVAGVWDPGDGNMHIINADDMRYAICMLEELTEKVAALVGQMEAGPQ